MKLYHHHHIQYSAREQGLGEGVDGQFIFVLPSQGELGEKGQFYPKQKKPYIREYEWLNIKLYV